MKLRGGGGDSENFMDAMKLGSKCRQRTTHHKWHQRCIYLGNKKNNHRTWNMQSRTTCTFIREIKEKLFIMNTQPCVTRVQVSWQCDVQHVQRNSAFLVWHWYYKCSARNNEVFNAGFTTDVVPYDEVSYSYFNLAIGSRADQQKLWFG